MKNQKIIISLLVIGSILINSPVYAQEIRLNSGVTIPITYLNNNTFEISNNVYSNTDTLLFAKGTIGNSFTGRIVDVSGNYHSFFISASESNSLNSQQTKNNGPKTGYLLGAAAAATVALPVAAVLTVVDCSSGSGRSCGGVGLVPFFPAAYLAKKAFE